MTTKEQQSSGSNGGELKTILLILLAVLASEVLLRATEDTLSGNIAHINEISGLIADYDSSQDNALMFLGNSLTNNGIDLPLIIELLHADGVPVGDSTKLVPDATTIWSWSCLLNNQFFYKELKPGVVVLGFGWDQMSDQSRILPTRLGAFFCSVGDLADINRHKGVSSGEAGEFLTARLLRTYAHRETIRNRVLSISVPHYQSITQTINRQQRGGQGGAIRHFTYSVLDNLIASLEDKDSSLIVVAMPVRDNPYEVEPGLRDLLASRETPLLDYRNLDRINGSSFLDDMHLSSEGASILSANLAKDLSAILASSAEDLSSR